MDVPSIIKVLNEREEVIQDIKQRAKKLGKLNELVDSLSSAYPELFYEAIKNFNNSDDISTETRNGWDSRLSLRRRVLELLREAGQPTKVSELAKNAFAKEPFDTRETEASLQEKISRTLTALKKIEKLGIQKIKIHSGSSGFAWGLREWEADAEEQLRMNYMSNNENIIENVDF